MTQSEGECPLSVHPVVRLQTLIVVCLAIDLLCNFEGENSVPQLFIEERNLKRKTYEKFLEFICFESFLDFSPHQVFLLEFKLVSNLKPKY